MDSGLYLQVFSSVEVIVAGLVLIFLLPLVFFIASARSRRRSVRVAPRSAKRRPVRRAPAKAEAFEDQDDPDELPPPGPRARSGRPAADPDDPR